MRDCTVTSVTPRSASADRSTPAAAEQREQQVLRADPRVTERVGLVLGARERGARARRRERTEGLQRVVCQHRDGAAADEPAGRAEPLEHDHGDTVAVALDPEQDVAGVDLRAPERLAQRKLEHALRASGERQVAGR